MKKIKNYLILSVILVPTISFAALDGLKGLMNESLGLLNLGIRIIFALALALFFWGLVQFIMKSGDAKLRDEGKQRMIWGIIALFVMISIYGILNFVGSLVGINPNSSGSLEVCPPGTINAGGTGPCD